MGSTFHRLVSMMYSSIHSGYLIIGRTVWVLNCDTYHRDEIETLDLRRLVLVDVLGFCFSHYFFQSSSTFVVI